MCEWKPDFEQLKEQTEENSRQKRREVVVYERFHRADLEHFNVPRDSKRADVQE